MKEERKDGRVDLPEEVEAGLGLLDAILSFFGGKGKKKKHHHQKHRRDER